MMRRLPLCAPQPEFDPLPLTQTINSPDNGSKMEVARRKRVGMKSAVVISLTLVLAAGPWLCCCTAGHITSSESDPASTPHKASCCGSVQQTTESPDDAPLSPARSCSCQAEVQPATLTVSANPMLDVPLFAILPVDCHSISLKLAIAVSVANESPPCSFLDSHDLLRVFHILRC